MSILDVCRKRWRFLTVAAAGTAAVCLLRSEVERKTLSVEEFHIFSPKIRGKRTLVFLSDLHDNCFGPGNEDLLKAIEKVRPDGILIGGDTMVAKGTGDIRRALSLVRRLAARWPVYCGNGNHESRMRWERETYGRRYEAYKNQLQAWGVHYLENDTAFLGEDIAVTGADLQQRFYRKAFFCRPEPMGPDYLARRVGDADEKRFQILLLHSPMYFENCTRWGADLTLCGHFHGGTIRLPLLGGVMTPQYQFFLPWCAGEFEQDGKRMIVSRGLGTHSINIRLNNLPQLVVIRLRGADERGR